MSLDLFAQQLSADFAVLTPDVEIRIRAAIWLRESIQHYIFGSKYAEFLEKLAPIFIDILKGPTVFTSTSPEQKLRICVLQILYQLPVDAPGPFEPYAKDVLDMLIGLVRADNEENALLCIKVMINIMGHQKKVLQDTFELFLDLVQHMFDQLVKHQLDNQAPRNSVPEISPPRTSQAHENFPRPASSVASISDLGLQQQSLPKAMASPKILAQCPIIAKLIVQADQSSVSLDIKHFFHCIKSVLLLQAKPQEQAHTLAAANGATSTGVSQNISNRAAFGDLITTQVNTMSLLACLSKKFGLQLDELTEFINFRPTIPYIIIQLLKDCPGEKWEVRKELLVATRTIINYSFRKIFIAPFNELLDKQILIGDGLTNENLQPMAFSMLADLIDYIRHDLDDPQICKIVEVYIQNLLDNFPGTGLQSASARVLLIVADSIAKMPNKVKARCYLIMILDAFGGKFAYLNQQYPTVKPSKLYAQQSIDASHPNQEGDPCLPDIFTPMPLEISDPQGFGADPVADNKALIVLMIKGLKNIFHKLEACYIGSHGFSAEEVPVVSELFHQGANVLQYYENNKLGTESQSTSAFELIANRYIFGTKEEKDLVQTFVDILRSIDPWTVDEIFYNEVPTALVHVPQLSEIFPTLAQRHKQMKDLEQSFNIHASDWFELLILSTLDIKPLQASSIYIEDPFNDSCSDLGKETLGQFQVTPRLRPLLQKISHAATYRLYIKPTIKLIIGGPDLEKGPQRTWNSQFRTKLCKILIQIFQIFPKPTTTNTSGLGIQSALMIIIDGLLDIEEGAHRILNSSLRATLYQHWKQFPREVRSLLVGKVREQEYSRFFAEALKHFENGPLREAVVEVIHMLFRNCADMAECDARYIAVINSINFMHSTCQFKESHEWLDRKENINWFKEEGKNLEASLRANKIPAHLRLAAKQASEQLMVIFTKFLEYHHKDLDTLFSFIEFVTNEGFHQTHPLRTYIYQKIVCNNSIEFKKTVVMRSIKVYASKSASQKTKAFLIRDIVNPIIKRTSTQESHKVPQLMDEAVIESIHTEIWRVNISQDNDLKQQGVDHARIEVLQLTALLVKYCPSILRGIWPDIIGFCLNYIRLEDIVSKYASHVVVCSCIAYYDVPDEIIHAVYKSLLGSSHREACKLVRQALGLIAPALPRLCSVAPNDRNPIWAAAPHQILIEDVQNIQQKTTVFNFLVDNPDFFYKYREKYIIPIVLSLRKIKPPSSYPNERRELVFRLMALVGEWERRCVEDKKFLGTERHGFKDSDKSEYETPTEARSEMINYLAEFIANMSPPPPKTATASHPPILWAERTDSMSLLYRLLQYWGDLEIDLSNIFGTLLKNPKANICVNSMVNALTVVRIINDVKPDILKNMPLMEEVREIVLKSDNSEICACLHDEIEINGLKLKSLLEYWSVA
ncbi:hypothetical protein OIDMADRAFT_62381 [Oidiodendron maius Zn]|uniref:Uncharacterized protein n=1 Tax=Oidiodendron maius (strain Zn) TaxID=913774 RepID=A0A0C3GQ77_OIDMZ|nr:hypothetical protein OIDMADRAFT_62381 [Oidiodendron maius Zn]